ncbi:MAG: hypothetical protein KDA79_10755, partial [Planctomycetaceae bacterium]|nr:hypothetical protein [Planctomycetaceae bacterium]
GWFTIAGSHGETVLTSVDAVFQPVVSFNLSENLPGLTAFTGHVAGAPAAMPVREAKLRQLVEATSGWQHDEDIVIRGVSPEDFLVPVASRSSRSGQLLRFRADYISEGLDEFRDVARLRGNLQLTLQSRLAFDGEFNHWADPPAGHEDLWTGDANLVYVFGYGTPVRLKIGGGANWQSSSGEMEYGLNSTYGLDISIKRPFVVSGSLDLGTLNGDRVFHGQATLGALLGILEIYAGYDWLDFGSLKMNGPVAGAGIWF